MFGIVALYVVGAWIVLQVAALAFPGMGIPEFAIRYVWVGAMLGLPVVLIFAWRFDITSHGLRRGPTIFDETTNLPLRAPDYILLLGLSAAILTTVFLLSQRILATRVLDETADRTVESTKFVPPVHSIAVLPFDNLSSDPEQKYFVAGMHDALISELARIDSLTVISRRSALHYEETSLTRAEIARELNVATIVDGSVLRSGDQVRIQIQLIASRPERHLLAQTYDRELSNVLKLQREITRDITDRIKVKLTPRQQSRLARAGTVQPESYTHWLKGNFHLSRLNEESFRKALASYKEAIDLDAEYAPAYAGMALAYAQLGGWHASQAPQDVIGPAKKAAERALALDPDVAEAYFALGHISRLFDWNWAAAERASKQGMALNPSNTLARIEYANFLSTMGRFEESIDIGRHTLQLDPLSPAAYNELGFAHWLAGHEDEALALYRESLAIAPHFLQTHGLLSAFYVMRGDLDDALAHLTPFESALPTLSPTWMGLIGRVYALAGREAEARALLADLLERRERTFVPASALAYIYLGLGEHEEALRWLETAYEERDVSMVWLKELPAYEGLRSNPRFQDILDRMDFPAAP